MCLDNDSSPQTRVVKPKNLTHHTDPLQPYGVDIVDTKQTYPESRRYTWDTRKFERVLEPAKYDDDPKAFSWLGVVKQYLASGTPDTPAYATWLKVRSTLLDMVANETNPPLIYDENSGAWTLKATNFRRIVVLCARECRWFTREATRKGVRAVVDGRPDLRRCMKCLGEKPAREFNAEASDKKKIAYGWGKNGNPTHARRFYTHHLCADCRYEAKARSKTKRKESTPEVRELRKQIANAMSRSHPFIKEQDDMNPIGWDQGVCLNGAYYFHKTRLKAAEQARNALSTWGDGQPLPKRWEGLLTPTMRVKVQDLFNEHVLAYHRRGQPPKCF